MNLEWLKKHKAAAIGGGVLALLIVYLLFRNSGASSSNSLGSAIAQQNQGQLQMAELNAQESAQSSQVQAELAASEYSTQAQEQEEQDQTVGSIAETIIPSQLQAGVYNNEISAEQAEYGENVNYAESLEPLEEQALNISTEGNRAVTGTNELALLLGEGNVGSFNISAEGSSAAASAAQSSELNALTSLAQGIFG